MHWGREGSAPPPSLSLGFILAADLSPPHTDCHCPRMSILAAPAQRESAFHSPFSLEMSGGEGGVWAGSEL